MYRAWFDACSDHADCVASFLSLLLPNTLEVGVERVAGAWRIGPSLGYSF
jgi:hypothetical protein